MTALVINWLVVGVGLLLRLESAHSSLFPDLLNTTLLPTPQPNETRFDNRTAGDRGCNIYPRCPQIINIGWKNVEPFFVLEPNQVQRSMNQSANATELENKDKDRSGIFSDAINGVIQICCSRARTCKKPLLNFTSLKTNGKELDVGLIAQYDMIFPVHGGKTEGKYYGQSPYIHVLDSPGLLLVVNKNLQRLTKKNVLVELLRDAWPMVLVTLLLTVMAGIVIWALDTYRNKEEFPRPFVRGALEGFWWAFVTMTTVGYGDRAPKSCFARLFGVLWITVGLVICSFLTATLTSALTALSFDDWMGQILSKKVAVVDNLGFETGLKLGATVESYGSMGLAYQALMEGRVDAALLEAYSGRIFLSHDDHGIHASITQVISSPYSLGIAVSQKFNKDITWDTFHKCADFVLKHKQNDVFKIVQMHTVQRQKNAWEYLRQEFDSDNSDITRIINPDSDSVRRFLWILFSIVGAMVTLGALYELGRRLKDNEEKQSYDVKDQKCHSLQNIETKIQEIDQNLTFINKQLFMLSNGDKNKKMAVDIDTPV